MKKKTPKMSQFLKLADVPVVLNEDNNDYNNCECKIIKNRVKNRNTEIALPSLS
jgi:hypothetical protein